MTFLEVYPLKSGARKGRGLIRAAAEGAAPKVDGTLGPAPSLCALPIQLINSEQVQSGNHDAEAMIDMLKWQIAKTDAQLEIARGQLADAESLRCKAVSMCASARLDVTRKGRAWRRRHRELKHLDRVNRHLGKVEGTLSRVLALRGHLLNRLNQAQGQSGAPVGGRVKDLPCV